MPGLKITFLRRASPFTLQAIAWFPTRLALSVFGRFEVRGRKRLRGVSQAIFAVNHSNEADPILLTAALGPAGCFSPLFYVMIPQKEVEGSYQGWHERKLYKTWFFEAWGSYALVRGLRDYEGSLGSHVAILKQGGSLCIFPEGGFTKTGELREFRGGVIHLSRESGVPIVPVAITGSYGMTFRSFFRRKQRLILEFGESIAAAQFKDVTPEQYRAKAARIAENIAGMKDRHAKNTSSDGEGGNKKKSSAILPP